MAYRREDEINKEKCQFLDKNIVRFKKSERFEIGFALTAGRKATQLNEVHMEDFLLIEGCFRNRNEDLFAVFDGHGGDFMAKFAADNFANIFANELTLAEQIPPNELDDDKFLVIEFEPRNLEIKFKVPILAFYNAFEKLTQQLKNQFKDLVIECGTTALVAFVNSDGDLYVANIGDSKAVMVPSRGSLIHLSKEHRPENEDERERIHLSGGVITGTSVPRLNGNLSVTRSLGDFKEQRGLIADPTIKVFKNFREQAKLFILGSDGLWDTVDDGDIKAIVREFDEEEDEQFLSLYSSSSNINQSNEQLIANEIIKLAFDNFSIDNISTIVVKLIN
eukprot:TRINITY_DN3382_c0_g4_i1.p1 TRINITY_DN3382_c0_g4~~TRINITY_DN3382_c0_g4_i1.p1  ORF type:complete len:335 (+),score=135.24 TRINITY_DN3382_c0_g4_i1:131-1135(+)